MDTATRHSKARKHLGLLAAALALPAVVASPAFAQPHGGGGGGHGFSGGHASSSHFSGGGHSAPAPHFAAAAHYAARPSYGAGGYGGGYHAAASYSGRSYTVGQQYGAHAVATPSRNYVAPGRGTGYAALRVAPGRFVAGTPFHYGYWNGGYWRGGFWPRVYWGASFPWFLPVLPAFAATYWWNSIPYYYYNDVYYTYDPSANGYVVTTPPPAQEDSSAVGADQSAIPPGQQFTSPQGDGAPPQGTPAGGGLYAYPKNGQSADQQSVDRQQCEQWAGGQSGSDGAGNSPDFQRALTACLQGRGYSVD